MAVAVQHAEVRAPWAYCFAILMPHDAGDLMQVREVVGGPCREELREGHGSKDGMLAASREVFRLEVEDAEFVQIFGAELGELVE